MKDGTQQKVGGCGWNLSLYQGGGYGGGKVIGCADEGGNCYCVGKVYYGQKIINGKHADLKTMIAQK